jgi:hypothetical protein
MKRIMLITFCVVLSTITYAQKEKYNLLNHITGSVGFKGTPVVSDNIHFTHIVDWSVGYKLKNKLSIGFNMENYLLMNQSEKKYENYGLLGFGIKYLMFELERNKDKTLSFEPYFNFFPDMNTNYLTVYDLGFNFVMPKRSYCFFGTGVMLNVLEKEAENFYSWYFSLGLRL